MALLKKIVNEVGQVAEYHRIKSIECDYRRNQIHVYIERYTNEEYRNLEKQELISIKKDIDKVKKNKKLEEFEIANKIQNLESREVSSGSINIEKYTLPMKDIFRKTIYKKIKELIPEFKEAEEV